jgi:outer membrane protein OmpA-like peptidoglycan-associated protein
MSRRRVRRIPVLPAVFLLAAGALHAQGGLLDRVTRRAGDRVQRNIERKVDEAVDCAMGDRRCIEAARKAGKEVRIDSSGARADGGATRSAGPGGATVGAGALVNFDFVPGDRPLFVEDFTRDRVGNFPQRLQFKEGAFEIVDWNGQRLLRATDKSRLLIPLPEALPERFTVEIDLVPALDYYDQVFVALGDVAIWEAWNAGGKSTTVMLRRDVTNTRRPQLTAAGGGVRAVAASRADFAKGVDVQPLRLLVDGRYLKGYLGGERLVNVPNATIPRGRSISLALYASADHPAYVGAIRIMAGGRALYDALAASGRVATQGIRFATGSDEIRVESTPTLDEIGAMLREHPDLRLLIEGHTDDVGNGRENQALSERRAAAVRQALVAGYGIDGSRLEAKGFGAAKPAASNATAEGRQQNRRVELVKR